MSHPALPEGIAHSKLDEVDDRDLSRWREEPEHAWFSAVGPSSRLDDRAPLDRFKRDARVPPSPHVGPVAQLVRAGRS